MINYVLCFLLASRLYSVYCSLSEDSFFDASLLKNYFIASEMELMMVSN